MTFQPRKETENYAIYEHGTVPPGMHPLELVRRNNVASVQLAMLYAYETGTVPPGSCLDPWEILALIQVAKDTPPGCFVEVGVFMGGSAWHLTQLARQQDRQIYLYDTFEGMPYFDKEDVAGVPVGMLKTDFAAVRGAVGPYPHMYKCVFPNDVDLPPERIAFAHIDVDAYRSTKETIEALKPLMASGGVMWFDDTNTLEGAQQAVRECFVEEAVDRDEVTNRWFVRFP